MVRVSNFSPPEEELFSTPGIPSITLSSRALHPTLVSFAFHTQAI